MYVINFQAIKYFVVNSNVLVQMVALPTALITTVVSVVVCVYGKYISAVIYKLTQ